ncbi:MAG: permease [Oligoflexia bacterium]|nr:permease [Oligoflexia bacterium]
MSDKSTEKNSVVAVFNTHQEAENAIAELEKGGIELKQLSIVGKDYHSEEHVIGCYNTGDRVKYWGGLGAFWGGIWGRLFGSAFFFIPGLGPLVVAEPLVMSIVSALEGAVVMGGFSALGAALYSISIPKDSILKYETSLKSNKFLMIVHGCDLRIEFFIPSRANLRQNVYQ